jgi:hypothetical protein
LNTTRLIAALRRLTTPQRLDFYAHYSGEVLADDGNGRYDVRLDLPDLPELVGVRIRLPFTGLTFRVEAGSRCLIGFENADPARPYIHAFEPGALVRLVIEADTEVVLEAPSVVLGGNTPVALVGGQVQVAGMLGVIVPTGHATKARAG